MNYAAEKHVSVWLWSFQHQAAVTIWVISWRIQQEPTILYSTALWLWSSLPCGYLANRLTLAGRRAVRRLEMADSWRPRHHWFFTHIKHWPIYCADWQTGEQSASAPSLKQAAPISETHIGWPLNIINQAHVCALPDTDSLSWRWTISADEEQKTSSSEQFLSNSTSAAVTLIHNMLIC